MSIKNNFLIKCGAKDRFAINFVGESKKIVLIKSIGRLKKAVIKNVH